MQRRIIDTLPQPAAAGAGQRVSDLVRASPVKAVVLDDDPTGTQTVNGIDVLAEWSVPSLSAALVDPRPCFFILTNTRSMPEKDAAELVREIAANLAQAARVTGAAFTTIIRGDSTLRGHFWPEIEAAEDALGQADARIVIPAFIEGGRFTVGNVHFLAAGDELIPVAQTEFARDLTFGYSNSDLTRWIEEKTGGRARASDVVSVGIEELRAKGAAHAVRDRLLNLPKCAFVVVNAAAYADLEVFTEALLLAEAAGRRFLLRTAASFVRVRAGITSARLLAGRDLGPPPVGALVVVGSYVEKTTEQLGFLLSLPGTVGIEVSPGSLATPEGRREAVQAAARAATAAIAGFKHAVVYVSRGLSSPLGNAGDLAAGRIVSQALVEIVRTVDMRPRFIVAKGGITSCDVAVHALGMRKALVIGQAAPGVPVWELGPETRQPGLRLVVWPGNVGAPASLLEFLSSV